MDIVFVADRGNGAAQNSSVAEHIADAPAYRKHNHYDNANFQVLGATRNLSRSPLSVSHCSRRFKWSCPTRRVNGGIQPG